MEPPQSRPRTKTGGKELYLGVNAESSQRGWARRRCWVCFCRVLAQAPLLQSLGACATAAAAGPGW